MVDSTIANAFLKDTINKLNDYPTFLETFALLKEWILNWSRLESSAPKQDKEKISDFFYRVTFLNRNYGKKKIRKFLKKQKSYHPFEMKIQNIFTFFKKHLSIRFQLHALLPSFNTLRREWNILVRMSI
jgi:hypothetical protein